MKYRFKVLTVRDLDFTDDHNKAIKGMQIWVIGETADIAWNGYEIVKIWIPDGHKLESVAASLKHDDEIEVSYDRRGKPTEIELV